jgi:hypothetical protein
MLVRFARMITYYDHVGEARARAPEGLERHDTGVAQSDKRGGVAGKPTKVVSVRTVQK